MLDRLTELHEQRGRLRERIAHQRLQLATQVQPLRGPLALPGRILQAWHTAAEQLRAHPWVAGAALLGLVVLRPRGSWRWARRALVAWRTWRSLRKWVPAFVAERLRSRLS